MDRGKDKIRMRGKVIDDDNDDDDFENPPPRQTKGKRGQSNTERSHRLQQLRNYYKGLKNEPTIISYGDSSYEEKNEEIHEIDWPGKQLSTSLDRDHINMFLKNEMTRNDYVWKSSLASVCRLDVHELIMGKKISINVIDCLICRFCRMMSYEKEKYESFLVFRPCFYESLVGNDKETIRREFGRFSLSSYEKAETLLFPILTLGHWHLLVLVKAQNKWVHYSPHITMSCYVNDAFSFSRRLGTYLREMWGIEYVGSWPTTLKDELPHKDDHSLDCGIIMLEYIRAIVFGDKGVNGDEVYMVDQSICVNLRAGYAADLITEGTYYEGTMYDTDFEMFQTIVGPAQVDAIRRVTEMYA